jgi:tRNA1(Val) A37 N6-methylase TrmN6
MARTLLGTNLQIEQVSSHAFNLDTILLADFIKVPYRAKKIADFGTGAGALLLYLSQKTNAKIIGVEIQESRYLQALYNIHLNKLEDRLSVVHQDIIDFDERDLDCIVSNPPFFKVTESSLTNQSLDEKIARHEIMIDLERLIQKVSKSLRYGGHFFLIHRPDRLIEMIEIMKNHQMEIKRIRFVHSFLHEHAQHVLVHATKNGQSGLKVEAPLIIYEEKHIHSKEMKEIYGGRSYVTYTLK